MPVVPMIRPISELKNTTNISNLCHKAKAPVFITKNGYSDLVIMSIDTYERIHQYERSQATVSLLSALSEGEKSAKESGWLSIEEVEAELGIVE